MKTRLKVAAASAAGLVALGLAGCSNPVAGGGTEASGAASAKPASSITLWHNSADPDAINQLYKDFTAKTGIKVTLVDIPSDSFETTTQTKWSTGDKPDVLEYHPTAGAILQFNPNSFVDLSNEPYVAKSGDLYKSVGSYDGKVYAAITQFPSIFGLYYNKKVLEDAGVTAPTNFTELTAACKALKAKGVTPIYESGQSQWPTQILPAAYVADSNKNNAYGDELFTQKAKINAANGMIVESLKAYQGLENAGCFQKNFATGTFEKATDAVYKGTAAMTALHSDALTQFTQSAGGSVQKVSDAVGFTGISKTSATAWYGPSPLGSYYVPKNTDASKQAAAIKFIEYATGDGYQKLVTDGKTFPVISGVSDPTGVTALQEDYKKAYDGGATLGYATNLPGWNFAPEISKLLAGQATPQKVSDNMESLVQQAASAAGLPGW